MTQPAITPREALDFQLDASIPKYWFQGEPFRTRWFDAMQLGFPDGERYFISSVRPFRDRVQDPAQRAAIQAFMRQEGQHGIAHTCFNELLAAQGLPMADYLDAMRALMAGYTRRFSPGFNLALTAAFEHFTALLAEAFFSRRATTEGVDPRMQALLAWHAIEEMEHRAVVFDLMRSVGGIGWGRRCAAMVYATWQMTTITLALANRMLAADGYGPLQRARLFARNLGWLFGRRGVISGFTPKILAYLRPGFHPEQIPVIHNYGAWVAEFERSADPARACNALLAAASA